MAEDSWYSVRRARWAPGQVHLLLIAESAPDDGGEAVRRRFFYDETLTGNDGLFREVVRVLYDDPPLVSGPGAKAPWLARLQSDGVALIDLAQAPVNHHSPAERSNALKNNIDATVAAAAALRPDGVILVKQNVFQHLRQPLLEAGLRVLHEDFIPFPGSGQQKRFRERFARAVAKL